MLRRCGLGRDLRLRADLERGQLLFAGAWKLWCGLGRGFGLDLTHRDGGEYLVYQGDILLALVGEAGQIHSHDVLDQLVLREVLPLNLPQPRYVNLATLNDRARLRRIAFRRRQAPVERALQGELRPGA